MMKKIYSILIAVFTLMFPLAAEGSIFWEIYLQSSFDEPILRKETAVGQEFVIRQDDFTAIPAQSNALIEAFDGVSLLINQCPLSGDVVFRMTLNTQGNNFSPVRQVPLFVNITFEGYSGINKAPVVQFSKSAPFVMTIPRDSGLDYLLGACNLSYDNDILFVLDTGGSFIDSGITTAKTASGIEVSMEQLGGIVGSTGELLGYPSTVRVDTWSKIKLLFR